VPSVCDRAFDKLAIHSTVQTSLSSHEAWEAVAMVIIDKLSQTVHFSEEQVQKALLYVDETSSA